MKKVASLRYGVIFKKAFCDPEIFSAFASDFTGIKLSIDNVETEKSFDPPVGRVAVEFDLFAEDDKNRVIVDIQHVRHPDHYHRFLHYHCAALLEQVLNSYNYQPELKVFTLVVLTSGDKYKKDISTIDFDPLDLKGRPIGEIHHKIIYICSKYVNEKTPSPYREWMLAINDSLDEMVEESDYTRSEILKVFEYIKKDTVSPYERAKMFDEYNYDVLSQQNLTKTKEETALNLLSFDKLTDMDIAQATGLTLERIKELAGSKQ
ncbi:transposase [Candidatus Magnetomoraceae bacterium gMMP-1]